MNIIFDIAILMGLGIIIWLVYFGANFAGLKSPDAMYYASIARNIVAGKGMFSDLVVPADMVFLPATDYFKAIHVSPLHPIMMSLSFYFFGVNDYSAAFSSGIFYLLAIPVIYLLARELFGRKVGVISALVYIISLNLLNYSISGLTESLFIFLLLLSFMALYKSSSARGFLLVGIILGLTRLTRINAIVFVLPFLAYIWSTCDKRKILNSLIFFAGFIGMSFPILYRDFVIFNDPIFSGFHADVISFKYSQETAGKSLILSNTFNFLLVILSDFPAFIRNYFNNMHSYYVRFFGIAKPLIMSFFIVGVFRWYKNKRLNLFKGVFLSSIIIQVILLSVSKQSIRYFHIFLPLITLFAVEFLIYLFERLPLRIKIHRYLAAGLLFVFLAGPFFYYLSAAFHNKITTNEKHQFYWLKDFLDRNTSPSDVIVADHGGIVWYGNRKILWLPDSVKTMEEIDRKKLALDAVLLTSIGLGERNQAKKSLEMEGSNEWRDLLYNPPKVFNNFVFIDQFDDRKMKAVLFGKK